MNFFKISCFAFLNLVILSACKTNTSTSNVSASTSTGKEPIGITWTKDVPAKNDIINGGAVTYNDEIYVITGQQGRFAKYNPSTYQWIDLPGLPGPRTHAGVVLWKDKIVVAGGVNEQNQFMHRVDYYDLKDQTWKLLTSLPDPRARLELVVKDNQLYACSGTCGTTETQHTTCADILAFIDSTEEWVVQSTLPSGREGHIAIYVGDRVYFIGGYGYKHEEGTLFVDHTNREFGYVPDLPEIKGNFGGIAIEDFIVTFGGKTKATYSTMEKFDTKSKKWTTLGNCPFWNDRFAYTRWKDRIYVFGGAQNPRTVWKGDIQFK